MRQIRSLLRWLNRYKVHILIWLLIWELLILGNPLEGDGGVGGNLYGFAYHNRLCRCFLRYLNVHLAAI